MNDFTRNKKQEPPADIRWRFLFEVPWWRRRELNLRPLCYVHRVTLSIAIRKPHARLPFESYLSPYLYTESIGVQDIFRTHDFQGASVRMSADVDRKTGPPLLRGLLNFCRRDLLQEHQFLRLRELSRIQPRKINSRYQAAAVERHDMTARFQ